MISYFLSKQLTEVLLSHFTQTCLIFNLHLFLILKPIKFFRLSSRHSGHVEKLRVKILVLKPVHFCMLLPKCFLLTNDFLMSTLCLNKSIHTRRFRTVTIPLHLLHTLHYLLFMFPLVLFTPPFQLLKTTLYYVYKLEISLQSPLDIHNIFYIIF